MEKAETDRSKARSERAYQTLRDDIEGESWVSLSCEDSESALSENIMSRMLAAQTLSDRRQDYDVDSATYLNALSPGGYGRSSDALQAVEVAHKYREEIVEETDPNSGDDDVDVPGIYKIKGKRAFFTFASLNSMSGVEQVRAVLKHTQIIGYKRLRDLCTRFRTVSNDDEEADRNLVRALDSHAHFIAGRWVVKSADVCSVANGQPPSFRDRLLLELAASDKKGTVKRSRLASILKSQPVHCLLLLEPLTRLNKETQEWEFKIPYDDDFVHRFPNTAKKQTALWKSQKHSKEINHALNNDLQNGYRLRPSSNALVFVDGTHDDDDDKVHTNGSSSGKQDPVLSSRSLKSVKSRDLHVKGKIQAPLTSALERHGVQAYGDLSKIASNHAGYNVGRAVVQSALKEIATCVKIGGKPLYVLKRHIEEDGTARQQLREIVLELYMQEDSTNGLKKVDIIAHAKSEGMETVPASLFNKVIKEFCNSNKMIWVFKMSKADELRASKVKGGGKKR